MRRFERREAEAMLPWLTELLNRVQNQQRIAREKHQEMEKIRAVGTKDNGELIMAYDFRQAKRELDQRVFKANEILQEIHSTGCQVKDIDQGLVDFPALIKDEEVYLCWKLGEPRILYYHRVSDGFAGRRRLDGDG